MNKYIDILIKYIGGVPINLGGWCSSGNSHNMNMGV